MHGFTISCVVCYSTRNNTYNIRIIFSLEVSVHIYAYLILLQGDLLDLYIPAR